MELAIITAKQVVILYCLILAGFAGGKGGGGPAHPAAKASAIRSSGI